MRSSLLLIVAAIFCINVFVTGSVQMSSVANPFSLLQNQQQEHIFSHGVYCHRSVPKESRFKPPVDALDMICQVYVNCLEATMPAFVDACFCQHQFMHRLWNVWDAHEGLLSYHDISVHDLREFRLKVLYEISSNPEMTCDTIQPFVWDHAHTSMLLRDQHLIFPGTVYKSYMGFEIHVEMGGVWARSVPLADIEKILRAPFALDGWKPVNTGNKLVMKVEPDHALLLVLNAYLANADTVSRVRVTPAYEIPGQAEREYWLERQISYLKVGVSALAILSIVLIIVQIVAGVTFAFFIVRSCRSVAKAKDITRKELNEFDGNELRN